MSRYFIGVAPCVRARRARARTGRRRPGLLDIMLTRPSHSRSLMVPWTSRAPPRRRGLGRVGIVAIVAVVGVLSVGGAVAMATGNGGDPPTTAASSATTTVHDHSAATGQGRRAGKHAGHHDHPALTPYAQRV